MISGTLRGILAVVTVGYAILGLALYFAPSWSSVNFAWKISPFVAMTMGGWCLGNALAGATIMRRQSWPAMLCAILYLGLFGLMEAGVLYLFRARVNLASPLAWLYLATIVGTAVFAIAAAIDGARQRNLLAPVGPRFGTATVLWTVLFILLVGFLGLYGLLAVAGMRGLNASIFPEVLSPFSLRAFGAFYFSLALAPIPMLWSRGIGNLVNHGFAMYGLVVLITVAAVVFIGRFDFGNRPTQFIYFGVYLAVGILVGIYLLRHGTGAKMLDGKR